MKFETIIENYKTLAVCPEKEVLEQYCKEQEKDGCFLSVLQESAKGGEDFRFLQCCIVRVLAVGFWYERDKRYENAVKRGIDGWKQMNFQGAANWFHNSILIPRMLLDTLLFMGDCLDEEQKQFLVSEVSNAYTEERYIYDIGANIIWTNTISLHLACYLKDERFFLQAADRINEEMRFADAHSFSDLEWRSRHWRNYIPNEVEGSVYEGVQRDYSFFEHGPLLHTGAYGKVYLFSLIQLMYECRGTDTLKEENCRFVLDYLLEHYRWTMIYETQDYSVIGRKIGVKKYPDRQWNSMEPDMSFLQLLKLAEALGLAYREEELEQTRKRLEDGQTAISGVRYFPYGKYLIQQGNALSVTIRMTCKDMLASESVNWENLKCWHLGDGVSYIYTDGKDYEDVFPVYDWKKIPGTTVEEKQEPVLDWKQHIAVDGSKADFCGGVSLDTCAVAAMELKKEGIRAKKAWFLTGDEWVCLGTDIWCDGEGEVITTINQMKKRGKLWFNGALAENNIQTEEQSWVGHCHVAYWFPKGTHIRMTSEKREGDWNDIAYDQSSKRPDTPFPWEADMITLWLEHGRKPEGASYEYRLMQWEEETVPKAKARVLANTPSMQAVVCGSCCMAVFWEKGELEIEGQIWKAEEPCIFIKNGKEIIRTDLKIKEQ